MRKIILALSGITFILLLTALAFKENNEQSAINTTAKTSSEFFYGFNCNGYLEEAPEINNYKNSSWWLSSGGLLFVENGLARTIQGNLDDSKWHKLYENTNPKDTDNGSHPQNLFRLVTKAKTKEPLQEVYFKIKNYNTSASEQRNGSNGVFVMNKYQNADNLYYAGIRVDGNAVIKKKIGGKYYTMATKPVFKGTYDHDANPILIPKNTRMGLRSEFKNLPDNSVGIKFFIDKTGAGKWEMILDVKDQKSDFGHSPFLIEGHAGLRTDFMDVEFSDYKIGENKKQPA